MGSNQVQETKLTRVNSNLDSTNHNTKSDLQMFEYDDISRAGKATF